MKTVINDSFDRELMMCILKEENLIDGITLLEMNKREKVYNLEALTAALKDYGVYIGNRTLSDMTTIYEIAKTEDICIGNYRVVKSVTRSKIRSMIGKWNPPSSGQMKIIDVVEEIYRRIEDNTQCEVYYYTGKDKNKVSKGKYAYKLLICKKMTFFVDLNRKIMYHILIDNLSHRR